MKVKGGNKYAIVATANKLAAIIFHRMANEQVEFSPVDIDDYQEKRNKAKIADLERKLKDLLIRA